MPREIPDWVDNTPYETEYELTMNNGDQNIQLIHLNREEYEALKAHLAALRGYNHQVELKRCADDGRTDEAVATAQEIYTNYPSMVVFIREQTEEDS
jgi:hypothetical protein